MTKKELAFLKVCIARTLENLTGVSTGGCPECSECGLPESPTEDQLVLASEAHFSWHDCDVCGSVLGGNRYPVHAVTKDGKTILHFDACEDCYQYIANGDLETED